MTGSTAAWRRGTWWRYVLCGAAATGVHWGVLILLVERAGMRPWWAAAVGAAVGAIVSYAMNRGWTFGATAARHRQALPRFLLVALLGAGGNAALVWLGSGAFGFGYLWSQAVATALILLLTYSLNARWSFAGADGEVAAMRAARQPHAESQSKM